MNDVIILGGEITGSPLREGEASPVLDLPCLPLERRLRCKKRKRISLSMREDLQG